MSVELPNAQEIATIAGFAMQLPERASIGEVEWATIITVAPRDEWLHFTFEPKPPYPLGEGLERVELYLWRFSLAVHETDSQGAIVDPPLTPEKFAERWRD